MGKRVLTKVLSEQQQSRSFILEPADNARLANLSGQFDEHLRHIERRLGVEISNRGNSFSVTGDVRAVHSAGNLLQELYALTEHERVNSERVHLYLQEAGIDAAQTIPAAPAADEQSVRTRKGTVKGRGPNQQLYLRNIMTHDISFGVGPAGTGKTYLAVACAVEALERNQVERIILARPAVEAGERLGFLPGDLAQKVDPYLRPLYDALYEMLGFERVDRLIERNVIEIAPLAYMRGRTLNQSFIILDEAQNTTVEQMKMFLTRIGFGSTAVITGDITQTDLPRSTKSGLRHVIEVLKNIEGISFTFFTAKDVVRHPLVQRIVTAYEQYEDADKADKKGPARGD